MSPVQQASLECRKAYIQQIEILHYIDFSGKQMIWTLLCKLWLYFTRALHPTNQHVVHYITLIKQFLTNVHDLIKYIMKYNRIWVKISFKLHTTINEITTLLLECLYQSLSSVCNNFWLRSNVDFGQIMRKKYVIMNIIEECYVEDTQLQLLWGVRKSNVTSRVTNYCCQKVISKVIILLLKGVTSNE